MICGDLKLLQDASVVSGLGRCETKNARYLSFIELMKHGHSNNIINIGTTYINDNPEFVFYYKYTASLLGVAVISIFVCHRGQGQFTISLPSEDYLSILNNEGSLTFNLDNYKRTSYAFDTKKPNEHKYLRSYYLQYDSDLKQPINLLPFKITLTSMPGLDPSVIKSVKFAHYKLNVDALKEEPFDIDILSNNGTVHKFHKLVLAAHSPVLKQLIIDSKATELKLDMNDAMLEVLHEFLYSGYIKDVVKYDPIKTLELANKYELKNLWFLLQYPLGKLITINNAIELGMLAHRHNMEHLENEAFTFIKLNPASLKQQYWKQLNDVVFIKKLFEFIHHDN